MQLFMKNAILSKDGDKSIIFCTSWCSTSDADVAPDASDLELLFLFVFFQMKVYLKQHRALVEDNETRVAACLKRQFQLPQF